MTEKQREQFEKNCAPHKWKPGQTGNPKGGNNATRFRKDLTDLLESVGGEKVRRKEFDGKVFKTRLEILVRKAYKLAEHGNFAYYKDILDRIGGKAIARHEISGADGGPIIIVRSGDEEDDGDAD